MNYTIATMEAIGRNQVLDISKDGNQYVVGIFDKDEQAGATKAFKHLDEAEAVFMRFADYFIKGLYSTADRIEMLQNA